MHRDIKNYTRILQQYIQGVIESCTDILSTSYWLHVELGKIFKKFYVKKLNDIYFLSYNFFKLLLVFYVVLQPRR
jgi:hypothetical protein